MLSKNGCVFLPSQGKQMDVTAINQAPNTTGNRRMHQKRKHFEMELGYPNILSSQELKSTGPLTKEDCEEGGAEQKKTTCVCK